MTFADQAVIATEGCDLRLIQNYCAERHALAQQRHGQHRSKALQFLCFWEISNRYLYEINSRWTIDGRGCKCDKCRKKRAAARAKARAKSRTSPAKPKKMGKKKCG
jgi:hypothetical protein